MKETRLFGSLFYFKNHLAKFAISDIFKQTPRLERQISSSRRKVSVSAKIFAKSRKKVRLV